MIPTWYAVIYIVVAWVLGSGMTYAFLRTSRSSKALESKKETRPLNVFDAYSDKELKQQRDETARLVRQYRQYGYNSNEKVAYLRQIDDEFKARENAKLAIESDRRTQLERDIAIFDTVYGKVLKDTEL